MRELRTLLHDITPTNSARILQGCRDTHADAKWAYNATASSVVTCESDPDRARTCDLRHGYGIVILATCETGPTSPVRARRWGWGE